MPNSLSVRDQKRFILTYESLLNDDDKRIHKDDIKTLSRILNKCNSVDVGQSGMTEMKSFPKDPATLKDTFSKLFDKLEAQHSKLHDKKEKKLKNIQQKLAPVVQDIHTKKINAHNAKINVEIKGLADGLQLISKNISHEKNEIAELWEDIAKADVQIKKLHNEIKPLDDALKNTSPAGFAAKDARRLKDTEAKISKIEAKKNSDISILNNEIARYRDNRKNLEEFADKHGVLSDLSKAESGAIYDNRDTGFGITTWHDHLVSDKYAIKHFGYDSKEGRRQYSDLIKVPNHEGKQWQKMMKTLDAAQGNIKVLQRQILQLENKCENDISQVKLENPLSAKQEIEQRINVKKEAIDSLEMNKKIALGEIKSCLKHMSVLEAKKSPLMVKMEELKSHIKQDS